MLNSAIIMGRLTFDPELSTTSTGLSYTKFTVAVDRGYVKPGEQKKTDFIRCVAWRQQAEFITKYFRKGSMIAVQGSIQVRNYEDRNGIKREQAEIIVDNVSFCGSKSESGTSGAPMSNAPSAPAEAPAYGNGTADDFAQALPPDDDLPF
ncbi:MAG: single-stranded DNA-binding protein [Clostridia bacterium]|nr:single-stranded DNA-binding protein [Clostridia bacterium]